MIMNPLVEPSEVVWSSTPSVLSVTHLALGATIGVNSYDGGEMLWKCRITERKSNSFNKFHIHAPVVVATSWTRRLSSMVTFALLKLIKGPSCGIHASCQNQKDSPSEVDHARTPWKDDHIFANARQS
ncbi:hypothetical protein V6N12_010001 [Hibiscus sabdariffa]|uniref:Uncharacterized protein n=1 Tax=Hibiscus sabdariffa TaxID=183260 RepID=A0ABR2ECE4_9ROSI